MWGERQQWNMARLQDEESECVESKIINAEIQQPHEF